MEPRSIDERPLCGLLRPFRRRIRLSALQGIQTFPSTGQNVPLQCEAKISAFTLVKALALRGDMLVDLFNEFGNEIRDTVLLVS